MQSTKPSKQRRGAGDGDAATPLGTVGPYELLRFMAEGGMGKVYLARKAEPDSDGRIVVVKTLRLTDTGDATFTDLFREEARVAIALQHPNIVEVFDTGTSDGTCYIAMEYVAGETLRGLTDALTKKQERPSFTFVASVIRDVALGLDYAFHTASTDQGKLKIVHRDIKLANIMVGRDGVARIIDFGVAYAANRSLQRTQTDVIKGTQCYMAPEQAEGRRDLDDRCDQFALGVVLWELCAGCALFAASTPLLTLCKVLKAEVPPPSRFRPDVPRELERVVMRMLQRQPDDRYPRCADVADELTAFLTSQGIGDAADHVAQSVAEILGPPLDDDVDVLASAKTTVSHSAANAAMPGRGVPTSERHPPSTTEELPEDSDASPSDDTQAYGTTGVGRRKNDDYDDDLAATLADEVTVASDAPHAATSPFTRRASSSTEDFADTVESGPRAVERAVGGALLRRKKKDTADVAATLRDDATDDGPVLSPPPDAVTFARPGHPAEARLAAEVTAKQLAFASRWRLFLVFFLLVAAATAMAGAASWLQSADDPPAAMIDQTDLAAGRELAEGVTAWSSELLQAVRRTVPGLAPKPPTVMLTSVPGGAVVQLDGVMAGKTPLKLRTLSPHVQHEIRLSLPGYRPRSTQVSIEPGEERSVHLVLDKRSRKGR